MDHSLSDYCTIGGVGIGVLTPEIAAAFDSFDLEELIRITFSVGLYEEYLAPNLTDRHLISKLLEALEKRGTTAIFLRAVRLARPDMRGDHLSRAFVSFVRRL